MTSVQIRFKWIPLLIFMVFVLGIKCWAQTTDPSQNDPKKITIKPKEERLVDQANAILKSGDDARYALELLNEALDIKPEFVTAMNNKGWALIQLERYAEAVAVLDSCIRLAEPDNPNLPSAYGNRASAYNALGKYREAITNYNKIIQMNPKDTLAYRYRGYSYDRIGKIEKAVADNRKIIRINPRDNYAYNYLAWVYASKAEGDRHVNASEALSYAKRAVEIDRNAGSLDTLAGVYARRGEFKEAVRVEKEAYRLSGKEKYQQLINAYRRGLNYVEWQKKQEQ